MCCVAQADPKAKLFYNDYGGEDMGVKSNKIYNLLAGLRSRGVPVDGVGLEARTRFALPLYCGVLGSATQHMAATLL